VAEYPVENGWVGEGLPYIGGRRRKLLDALGAGPDLSGGEATAAISPRTAERVFGILRRRGFRPEAYVRMRRSRVERVAEGEAAVEAFLTQLKKPHGDHFHWPGNLLFVEPRTGSRFLVDTDLDGTVLELLCWGPAGPSALTEVIRALWESMRVEGESPTRRMFRRSGYGYYHWLRVAPIFSICVSFYPVINLPARITWIATSLVILALLHRAGLMGVTMTDELVSVVNFFSTTRLRPEEIDRFEPDTRWPDVKLLTEEHPARVVLKDGTAIAVTALQPRYNIGLANDQALRSQIAQMNRLLGRSLRAMDDAD
jgi:hypothetical protein